MLILSMLPLPAKLKKEKPVWDKYAKGVWSINLQQRSRPPEQKPAVVLQLNVGVFMLLFFSLVCIHSSFILLETGPCCDITERHRDLNRPESIKVTPEGPHRHILGPAERELQPASCSSPHT